MSPPPVRVETKARARPVGEKSGRDSVAGCETSSRASPPVAATDQMSPPDTKAISRPSAEMPGSASTAGGPCARDPVVRATIRQPASATREVFDMGKASHKTPENRRPGA